MFQTLFGDPNEKIQGYSQTINAINRLEEKINTFNDTELQNQTNLFIQRLTRGEHIDSLLVESFAVVREASKRVLGLRHFDVQLIGGLILHEGKIAEMRTGEGKTLVAVLPSYVNALTGKGVHVVTVNDYLAARDAEYIGQIHKFLGLSVGLIQQTMSQLDRRSNYSKDITYTTNSELGFDYLRDNMAIQLQDIVQRPFYFSILDEVDSILIDEARTPLIISGAGETPNVKYIRANIIAQSLIRNTHYEVDEKAKNILLTEEGVLESETQLKVTDLYNLQDPWAPYIFNALKAKELFIKDIHYIVKDAEVLIVDEFTGRIMIGRRWSDGLHQAIEAKENTTIQNETQTLASITYQNFFLLYPKLSGMTGTAKTEESELDRIYGLEVTCVPTHKKMIRKDLSDLVYKTQYIKWKSIADECLDIYTIGRPILIGTTSVEKSELLSSLLEEYGIPHNLLNAKPENLKREAEIVAQAGRKGAVTIATNMAGRGTDILLGGNSNYMSRSTLKRFLDAIFFNFPIEQTLDSNLQNLHNFLSLKIKSKSINESELSSYISIACEKTFTDDPFIITLRAVYQILIEIYNKQILREREEVINLGGLHVIGTERHESRRIDNQLRGRSGRQGDPGSSRFFLSLEDNLLRIFGGDRISKLMDSLKVDDDIPIESGLLNKSLESAQKKVEAYYYDARKQLFEYDEVLNYQRQAIYSERRRILESDSLRNWVIQYAETTILDYFDSYMEKAIFTRDEQDKLLLKVENLLGLPYKINRDLFNQYSKTDMRDSLLRQTRIAYDLKESQIDLIENGLMRELERSFLLQKIDSAWKEHLQQINTLRENIGWRGYGQKDPLIEYKNEAYSLFLNMTVNIRHSVVYLIFRSQPILKI
uniref:Protein translocase subunit SecA n=1 Tax=Cryptomonas curvata TaxID=233186 RepID=A0A222AH87_9CRYP|nr:preprotein translocase subunit SecA [Cryptomonas curvata]ASO75736.1 preprotein translocase subunit SecA [Cryptomonas curvata]